MKLNKGKTVDGGLDFIPILAIFFHNHKWLEYVYTGSARPDGCLIQKKFKIHFHIGITWLFWFIELQIGKDFIDGDTL